MQPSFIEVAESIGLRPQFIREDDRIHRCPTELHPKSRNGAYRCDGYRGWVKNWESGETAIWHEEREARHSGPRVPLPSLAKRRAEEAATAAFAAQIARHKVSKATLQTHPYLAKKGFPKMRGLVLDGLLLVPARIGAEIVSLQEITSDGMKTTLKDSRIGGASFTIGSGRDEILVEGYATGLSVWTAASGLHLPVRVTCCFAAANVAAVAERRPNAVVVADNDKPLPQFGGLGAGEFYAHRTGLPWVMPPVLKTDANDLHPAEGLPALQALILQLFQQKLSAA